MKVLDNQLLKSLLVNAQIDVNSVDYLLSDKLISREDVIEKLIEIYGKKQLLIEIAQYENLELIETTESRIGYPSYLECSLIGFQDWEHYLQVQEEYCLQGQYVDKREGWQLWHRTNNTPYKPFELTADVFGCDYDFWTNDCQERAFDWFKSIVFDNFSDLFKGYNKTENDFNTIEEFENWLKYDTNRDYDEMDLDTIENDYLQPTKELIDAINNLPSEDYVVVTYDMEIHEEKMKLQQMSYVEDVTHNAIALTYME